MATTPRVRTAATGHSQNRGARSPRVSLRQRFLSMGQAFNASLPDLMGTPRFRREILGVVLVLLAMLSAYVIGRGGDEGRFVAWWGESLNQSLGNAALLMPLLLALSALRAFGTQQ